MHGAAQAADWKQFSNDRYGFSIEVPAAYKALPPPANDDGLEFVSPDGQSRISAYGHLFVEVKGLVEDERAEERMSAEGGEHITYRQVSSQASTFSGTQGGRIKYQYAITTCKGIASAILYADYPQSQKARFDPLIAHMARSLRGSNNCWAPG